jgi:hypothetical protein
LPLTGQALSRWETRFATVVFSGKYNKRSWSMAIPANTIRQAIVRHRTILVIFIAFFA